MLETLQTVGETTMKKTLELLKDQETQIIEFGQINSNTIMLMNIKQCIAELEEIDKLEKQINLSPYDAMSVYLIGDINKVMKG